MKRLSQTKAALLLLAGAALLSPRLHAIPMLMLYDGTTTKTIFDGGVGDSNAAPNVISFNGSIGAWTLTVSTGLVLGTTTEPQLVMSSVDRSSRAGTLTLYFSANGFGPTLGGDVDVAFGGTLAKNASIQLKVADNPNNVLLNRTNFTSAGTVLTSQSFTGPNVVNAFSGEVSAPFSVTGPYSISEMVKITHTAAGVSSFGADAVFHTPDGGTTAAMLGAGLLLVAYFRRRLAQA